MLFFGFQTNTIAQNNLQFNQIITSDTMITGSVYWPSGVSHESSIYIVPNDKICKIVKSKLDIRSTSGSSYWDYEDFKINDVAVNIDEVWLREGDEIKFEAGGQNSNSNSYSNYIFEYFISIIEYNLIPD